MPHAHAPGVNRKGGVAPDIARIGRPQPAADARPFPSRRGAHARSPARALRHAGAKDGADVVRQARIGGGDPVRQRVHPPQLHPARADLGKDHDSFQRADPRRRGLERLPRRTRRQQLGRLSGRQLLEAGREEARSHSAVGWPGSAGQRADGHQTVQAPLRRAGADAQRARAVHLARFRSADLPARYADRLRVRAQSAAAGEADRAARSAGRLAGDPHRLRAACPGAGPGAEARRDSAGAGEETGEDPRRRADQQVDRDRIGKIVRRGRRPAPAARRAHRR